MTELKPRYHQLDGTDFIGRYKQFDVWIYYAGSKKEHCLQLIDGNDGYSFCTVKVTNAQVFQELDVAGALELYGQWITPDPSISPNSQRL